MNLFNGAPPSSLIAAGVGTLILICGVTDDLRSRKFRNGLFLACAGLGTVASLAQNGFGSGLAVSASGFLAAFALMLPLVLTRVLGAGDLKLLAAFGAATGWSAVLSVAALSLAWGAVVGVVQAVVNGRGLVLARNLIQIATARQSAGLELNKMPYSIALLMGWLSALTLWGLP